MRLALLGHPISHSRSPEIYRSLLGGELESYKLLDITNAQDVPTLDELRNDIDGLSITAPYKKHFIRDVKIPQEHVKRLGVINTIAFRADGFFATNTDLIATEYILNRFRLRFPQLRLILLGDGSMAEMTILLADRLGIPVTQFSRKAGHDLSSIDLSSFASDDYQTVVINSCSRSYVFKGVLHSSFIFWDFNYAFEQHQRTIPAQVSLYYDGQEMLELQAQAALEFWRGKKA